ncbi:hypothetical protein [Lacipirellula limnantheis]|uniref:Carboxypeptidase regulatory-like domain-containing protein n=1 Tax=Lacipirellula limnantheis TaxID=2528024 RepID=A0A517U4G0_9BACT|nr:hypothetical protein [Lacipirellula limnantheis]QDT75508.1 hypothetical protein I41_47190 [Lacipirellula limnantheis]
MSSIRLGSVASLVIAASFALGCSGQDPNRGQITGLVEVDGQPAAKGAIAFTPVDGNSPASGGDIVDGRYTVNAFTGPSKVAIRVPKVVGQRKLYDTPDSPIQSVMEESLPPQFNDETTLTYDVKPGPNEQNFSLKTK